MACGIVTLPPNAFAALVGARALRQFHDRLDRIFLRIGDRDRADFLGEFEAVGVTVHDEDVPLALDDRRISGEVTYRTRTVDGARNRQSRHPPTLSRAALSRRCRRA
jgi:hypothetical protein